MENKYRGGFKLFLEEVQNINSDKEVKIKNYQLALDKYNKDKGKFVTIFSKDPNIWEKEANLIIAGNKYLGIKWKIDKMNDLLKKNDLKIKSNELTTEEEVQLRNDILKNKNDLNKLNAELNLAIKNDLDSIKKL